MHRKTRNTLITLVALALLPAINAAAEPAGNENIHQKLDGVNEKERYCETFTEQYFLDRFEYPTLSYQSIRETAEMISKGEPLLDGTFLNSYAAKRTLQGNAKPAQFRLLQHSS